MNAAHAHAHARAIRAAPVRFLSAGDFHFGPGPLQVRTLLGTCVAITLWHPARHIGGMCHFVQPRRTGAHSTERLPAGRYADEVMGLFADRLRATGTAPAQYVVKVFGGGNMFPDRMANVDCRRDACTERGRASCRTVGCQNIRIARELQRAGGYSIAAENVGGHGSLQLLFDLGTGAVAVKRFECEPLQAGL
jgi:chemotaxis protein CheD